IDETAVWNRALTNAEITSLFSGTTGNPTTEVASSLPAEGSTVVAAIDRFSVSFNRSLQAGSATTAANYDLSEAGSDGIFGTSDDTVYGMTPSYTSGALVVNLTGSPNPLQPGRYQFQTLSGLTDSNGNPVAPFALHFTVVNPVAGQIENTNNDSIP